MLSVTHPTERADWVLVCSESAGEHLAALIEARRRRQPVRIETRADAAQTLPTGAEAVLVIGARRRTTGLFVRDAAGRRVPVGHLPDAGPALELYAQAAASVLEQRSATPSLVVLGEWEQRFLSVCLRTANWVRSHRAQFPFFHWAAERLCREHLLAGLSYGPGAVMYFGCRPARGGHAGARTTHFKTPWPEPVAALLAICCEKTSRHRTGSSFAEDLALRGVVGSAFAALTKTRPEDDRHWGPALCATLTERRPGTLAEWIEQSDVPAELIESGPYRFVGDPTLPLGGQL